MPTDHRRTLAPRCRAALGLVLLLGLAQAARAQGAPDAGSVLRELAPAPALPGAPPQGTPVPPPPAAPAAPGAQDARFTLKSVRLTGMTVFAPGAMDELVAGYVGQSVSLADLEALAAAITARYRGAGYALAQVVVPVQDVTDGNVQLSVLEGRLGRLTVEVAPQARVPEALVRGLLAGLVPGEPVRQRELERGMLLVSDLPGVLAESFLEAGTEPGTVDLVVSVRQRRAWDLTLDADNHGTRSTGEYRLGVMGRLNSPFGLGDNLDARLTTSTNGNVRYARLAYEAPVGQAGTRAGLAFARVEYSLGGAFAALDASGSADVWELSLLHPVIRSRASTLVAQLSLASRRLDDRLGAVGLAGHKRLRDLGLGFAFDRRDRWAGGGYTGAAATWYFSDLDIGSAAERAADATGRNTQGHSQRLSYQLSRLNTLTGRATVFLGLSGQWADQNLDSAARVALGGPRGVRAYTVSEGVVDRGQVATAELRYALRPDMTLSLFSDHGWGRYDARPVAGAAGPRKVSLHGWGLGLFWAAPQAVTVRASLAWRGSREPTDGSDRRPRLLVQLVKGF